MSVALDHTIVPASDTWASATFLTSILGLPPAEEWGPFVHVDVGGVHLEYLAADIVNVAHYAFLVDDDTFDAALERIRAAGVRFTADPYGNHPGMINHLYGGRGLYFTDPDGHQLEMMTTRYGDAREFREL